MPKDKLNGRWVRGGGDVGKKHHKLLVLKEEMREHSEVWCLCRCDCGIEKWVRRSFLRRGLTKTCGSPTCLPKYESDLDKRYHQLLVLKEATRQRESDGKLLYYCYCRCDCGTEKWVFKASLRSGRTKSCGCQKITHGHSGSHPLYHIWNSQKGRCYNRNGRNWKDYGGRGITMYEAWVHDFSAWLAYVERLPHCGEPGRSLDRIENNGNYEPGNLRWATPIEQANNTRNIKTITCGSETRSESEWSRLTGIPVNTLSYRLAHGWSPEKTVTTPVRKCSKLQELDLTPLV
jgi:hypothetical protein